MLKALSITLYLHLAGSFCSAQARVDNSSIPFEIQEDFALRFHDAKRIEWFTTSKASYFATFKIKRAQGQAFYDEKGLWQRSSLEVDYLLLPKKARSFCYSNYGDAKVLQTVKVSTREYGILFDLYIEQHGKRFCLTFDQNGTLLSKNTIRED